ncbi:molybdopterin molybdotransferase MoeA [Flavisericum labens]|uniref:molybdopterin molybdotransferase MoeA n=1 Tax=Flavisericum labens TaxID=3377112 RepID=UPI00387AFAD9
MISIREAVQYVKKHSKPLLREVTKPLEKSGGYVLCKDVISPIDMPPFRQSAMDGYALNLHTKLEYDLIGEIKAGDNYHPILEPGETVRIFTGAAVPKSANAVVMQEKVELTNSKIRIEHHIDQDINIRPQGEQVKKGSIALKKGTKLTPAAIGYLASLGITEVSVYKKPSISIVTTGNELIEAGQPLPYGKIYESNATMLQNALYQLKFYDITFHKIEDDYKKTVEKLQTVINKSDLVIATGGISVGDYDFVGKALNELGVKEIFYKVKQKPGKPLYFGKKDNTLIFALPGNPAAALTCFYIYTYMALQLMMNREAIELSGAKATSVSSFHKKGDRPQFLKAIFNNGEVEILEGQSSSMLQTFALSNAIVFMPEDKTQIKIGDILDVILLPV